jgi:glutamine cyclotransferase
MAVRRRKKTNNQQGRAMTTMTTAQSVTEEADKGTTTATSQRTRFAGSPLFYFLGILGALILTTMVLIAGVKLVAAPATEDAAAAEDAKVVGAPPEANVVPTTYIPGSAAGRGSFRVLAQYPHDAQAFTQGLEVANATHAYESTGLNGQSTVRLVEIATGRVVRKTALEDAYFGEGLTLVQPSADDGASSSPYLLQLTWKKGKAFCYDPVTLSETCRFDYSTTNGQGWGIAYDTTNSTDSVAYVTDGTDYLHTWRLGTAIVDGSLTYEQTDRVPVQVLLPERADEPAQRIPRLNELEYDATTRTLLANVWFENVLLRIDPSTGWVSTIYDLSSLYTDRAPGGADVLNGIAVLPGTNGRELWVTGKLWPALFHIELID